MRYVGGKQRIAKKIAAEILAVAEAESIDTYIEPFVGGGAVGAVVGNHFAHVEYSDLHEDLILMWQALHRGDEFPASISLDDYKTLRSSPPSALRGLVGFGGSFSGKWFGGYAKGGFDSLGLPRNHYGESLRRSQKDVTGMRGSESTQFVLRPYSDVTPRDRTIIYADPPYKGTLGYGMDFDHETFWKTVLRWSLRGSHVFVSEYVAPEWAKTVFEEPLRVSAKTTEQGRNMALEKLFHVPPLTAD